MVWSLSLAPFVIFLLLQIMYYTHHLISIKSICHCIELQHQSFYSKQNDVLITSTDWLCSLCSIFYKSVVFLTLFSLQPLYLTPQLIQHTRFAMSVQFECVHWVLFVWCCRKLLLFELRLEQVLASNWINWVSHVYLNAYPSSDSEINKIHTAQHSIAQHSTAQHSQPNQLGEKLESDNKQAKQIVLSHARYALLPSIFHFAQHQKAFSLWNGKGKRNKNPMNTKKLIAHTEPWPVACYIFTQPVGCLIWNEFLLFYGCNARSWSTERIYLWWESL